MTLRGALVGCGYIAHRHVDAWAATRGAGLVAVCDLQRERAEALARRAGASVAAFADVDALFDAIGDQLDFIDISTPPEHHRPIVEWAAAHGVAVLCQKPIAATWADSEAVAHTVAQTGVTFAVNEIWKWIPAYQRVGAILRDGRLGRLGSIRFVGASNLLLPRRHGTSFAGVVDRPSAEHREQLVERFSTMPKLIVLEYGVHVLDMIREWCGDPRRLRARLWRTSPELTGDDGAAIDLAYDDFDVSIALDWCQPGPETADNIDGEALAIRGEHGLVTVAAGKWVEVHPAAGPAEHVAFDVDTRDAGFACSHQDFIDAMLDGRTPMSDVAGSMRSQALVMACYASADDGGGWVDDPAAGPPFTTASPAR